MTTPTSPPTPAIGKTAPMSGYPLTPEQCEHLDHMTDGRWHDACDMCLHRRVHSGTGIPEYDAYLRSQHPELAPEATQIAPEDRKDAQ